MIALDLARACFLESGWREADCAAIAFVIARRAARAGVPFSKMLRDYSALGHSSARARLVRTWPWGDVDGMSATHNDRWAALRQHVERIAAGEVANPCAGALHWGGRSLRIDQLRAERAVRDGRWARVRCSERTVNAFYRVRGIRADPSWDSNAVQSPRVFAADMARGW